MSHTLKAVTATVAAAAMAVAFAPTAQAGSSHHHPNPSSWNRTLTTKVVMPFQLAVNHGNVFVADGATSLVSRIAWNGALKTVATGPQPGEVAGVDLDRSGRTLAYTSSAYAAGPMAATASSLTIKRRWHQDVVADLHAYEQKHNPDGKVSYGVDNPSQCVKAAFAAIPDGPPVSYKGIKDTHPYAVASLGHGSWVVADAAGNDLLKVNARGKVSTLAVLPRQPLKITKQIAAGMGMPHCVVGVTYNFEPVPTDVEVDRHGMLWVSTLPGGPEDPSLGARGSVYKVNPWTGRATRMATGFAGATNLAVTRSGRVFVTEFFGGQISTIRHGQPQAYLKMPGALSVEAYGNSLYVGATGPMGEEGPTGPGSVVKVKLHR